ncbi:Separase [Aphelenchoides besseyi]|nr:Separase [Aphelenchoides besseyi]
MERRVQEAYEEYKKYQHLLYSIWRQEICLFMATYWTKIKKPNFGYRIALYLTEMMTVGLRAAIRRQAFENDFDAHRNAKTPGTANYLIENAMEQMTITAETCSNFVARKAPMLGYFPSTNAFDKCIKGNFANRFCLLISFFLELPTDFTIIQLTLNGQQDLFMTRIHRDHEPLTIPLGRFKLEHFDSKISKNATSKQPTTVDMSSGLEVDSQNPQLLGSSSSRLAAILRENERTATHKNLTVSEFWTARNKLDKELKELVADIQTEVFGDAWPLCCTFNTRTDKSIKEIQELIQNCCSSKPISFILSYLVDQLEKSDWIRVFKLLSAHYPLLFETQRTARLEKSIEKYADYRKLHGKSTATEDRYVFLIVSPALTHIPWETLPVFRKQMVSRIPSFYNLHLLLQKYETVPRAVNAESSYYVLNPTGNLANTQARMEKLIERMQWDGVQGQIPSKDELLKALRSRDLYIYLGHGSGRKYIGDSSELRKILCQSVCLLMGCSSLEIQNDRQGYDGRSVVYDFISASCPCIIGCLWMATDGELDRFFIAFMEFCFEELSKVREKVAASKTKIESDEAVDSFRFMMRGILRARNACKLPFLTGGTVISYGLPTIAGNGKPNRDVPKKRNGKFASSDVISVSSTVKSDNWEQICKQYSAKKK